MRIGDQVSNKKKKKGSRRTIKWTWRKKNGKKAETKLEKEKEQQIRKRIVFFMSSPLCQYL